MEKAVFENLKKFKYDDSVELSKLASWAIWDKKDIENTKIIEENIDNLSGKIVFVALNFSTERQNWKDWQNFHCDGRGDRRLRDLLSETRYKGAYMTDLIKNYNNPKAEKAVKIFETNETKRNMYLEFLFQEIEMLKTNDIEMYLFGGVVERLFRKYIYYTKEPKGKKPKGLEEFKQKIKKCQRIHHYSPSVTDFEIIAPIQLDLPITMEQIKEKCTHILWDNEQK